MKKKLIKSKGKWLVVSYSLLALGLTPSLVAQADEVSATTEPTQTVAETLTSSPQTQAGPETAANETAATQETAPAASQEDPAPQARSEENTAQPAQAGENLINEATLEASNNEANTQNTVDKLADNDQKTRWATDVDVEDPTVTVTFAQKKHIERIEIDWDARRSQSGEEDPNVKQWTLFSYDASKSDQWEAIHTSKRDPLVNEVVNLKEGLDTQYLLLAIEEYVAGKLQWRNVAINELRLYSTKKDDESQDPSNLKSVNQLKLSADGKRVIIPEGLAGQVSIIGTNASGVIDKTGAVYRPLTDQTVKLSVQQVKDGKTVVKEFTLQVAGQHADEGVGTKPAVVPIVQQWHGVEGKTSITADTALVGGAFDAAASLYQKDLAARGLQLKAGDANASSRIEFVKVDDKGYGKEGYGIKINNGVITIEAADKVGAFYATRTLLQMGQENLQNGEIRDYPAFEHRGFMLDTGRKFVPYEVVMQFMENMAYYKLNDFQLHLNDNFIFLKEHLAGKNLSKEEELQYVLEHAAEGFRLETDIVGKDGQKLTSKDHYTKEQFQNIIKRASQLGINLVPEIDTPGHALSFVKVRPDLMYTGQIVGNHHNVERVAMLDLENKYDETLAFVKSVYNKLLDGDDAILKGIKTIHIGTDEYYGNPEAFRRFTNDMIAFIKSKGLTPRVWGSLTTKQGKTAVDFSGTEVDIWNVYWQDPQEALDLGAKIINITDSPTYSVPDGSGKVGLYGDISDYRLQYESWTPNDFSSGWGKKLAESNPNIIGGSYAIWNDNIDLRETGITSHDMFLRFFKVLPVTAERTWGSDRAPQSYDDFQALPDTLKYAPTTNPDHQLADHAYFTLNKENLKNYPSENVRKRVGLVFDKNSSIRTKADKVGLGSTLTIDVKLTGTGVQTFSSDGKDSIFLVDKDGRVAYQHENHYIQFNTKLKPNKRVQLKFVTTLQDTKLYVNNILQERLTNPAHPKLAHTTFIMPLGKIGGFEGILYEASLRNQVFTDPSEIKREDFASLKASSEHTPSTGGEGEVGLAFDNDPSTRWHSHWTKKDDSYTVEMNLKAPTAVNSLRYLPRQDGDNGIVTSYEVYAKVDGQLVKVASGDWEKDTSWKLARFDKAVETDQIVFKIVKGVNGFASASEIALTKAVTPLTFEEDKLATKVYTDPETGVSVQVQGYDAEEELTLSSKEVKEADLAGKSKEVDDLDYKAYDIHLSKDSANYAIQEEATVRIPIPAGKTVKQVLYLLPTGDSLATESLDFTVEGKEAVFKVSHFSHYALVFSNKASAPTIPVTPSAPKDQAPAVVEQVSHAVARPLAKEAPRGLASASLPNTGQSSSAGLISSIGASLLAGLALFMGKKKKEDK